MQVLMLLLWTGALLGHSSCQNNAGSLEEVSGEWAEVGVWGREQVQFLPCLAGTQVPGQALVFMSRQDLDFSISKIETTSCPSFQRTQWG